MIRRVWEWCWRNEGNITAAFLILCGVLSLLWVLTGHHLDSRGYP